MELGGLQRGKDGHRQQQDRGDLGPDEFALVDDEAPMGVVARYIAHGPWDQDQKTEEDGHALDVHRPAHTEHPSTGMRNTTPTEQDRGAHAAPPVIRHPAPAHLVLYASTK